MNNDLEQFSEERLKKICDFTKGGVDVLHVEIEALARIALSAKQAKPFCYVSTECIKQSVDVGVGVGGGTWAMSQKPYNGGRGFDLVNPLYTTPQPAHTEQDGWTSSDAANAALVMIDRIDTTDPADDDRIEGIKRIIRQLAASPKPESE